MRKPTTNKHPKSTHLPFCDCGKNSGLNSLGLLLHLQVLEHHHRGKQEGCGVGEVLSSDVRRCSVNLVTTQTKAKQSSHGRKAGKWNGSRICLSLKAKCGRRAHRLKDGTCSALIARGSETEAPDQASTHVTHNVPVKVGHHQHVKLGRVLHNLYIPNGVVLSAE